MLSMGFKFAAGRREIRAFATALALTVPMTVAQAQGFDCDRLRAQIASTSAGNPGQGARYQAAIEKQRYELNRTAAYSQSLGCNNRQFLFFGSAPPAQCGGIEARMAQMRANLGSLQAQASAESGGARQALQARYDATCRGQRGGLFDSLFNGGRRDVPIDSNEFPSEERPVSDQRARGGSEAVCVRTCDGGYFPVSYSARRDNLDSLQDLCKAQCPGAETALYTMPPAGEIEQAVSLGGEDYSDLPNAGKFRKSFDPTCACKPANSTWVASLAQAEELLGRKFKSDIVVTPEKSREMSRPNAAAKISRPAGDSPEAAIPAKAGPVARFGLDDGETSEIPNQTNGRRKVRIIAPKL